MSGIESPLQLRHCISKECSFELCIAFALPCTRSVNNSAAFAKNVVQLAMLHTALLGGRHFMSVCVYVSHVVFTQ